MHNLAAALGLQHFYCVNCSPEDSTFWIATLTLAAATLAVAIAAGAISLRALSIASREHEAEEKKRALRPDIAIHIWGDGDARELTEHLESAHFVLRCDLHNGGDATLEDATLSVMVPKSLAAKQIEDSGEIKERRPDRLGYISTTDWIGVPGGPADIACPAAIYDLPMMPLAAGAKCTLRFAARTPAALGKIPVEVNLAATNYEGEPTRALIEFIPRPVQPKSREPIGPLRALGPGVDDPSGPDTPDT